MKNDQVTDAYDCGSRIFRWWVLNRDVVIEDRSSLNPKTFFIYLFIYVFFDCQKQHI